MTPDYNQSMNSPEACRRRLLKYVVPVFIFSILFNVPKFMEAELQWLPPPTPTPMPTTSTIAENDTEFFNITLDYLKNSGLFSDDNNTMLNDLMNDTNEEMEAIPIVSDVM